jgi:hypothetical protein
MGFGQASRAVSRVPGRWTISMSRNKMSKLLYRGPGLDVLHEAYAKRGRIDDQAPITASQDVGIDAGVADVWALLSDPTGWWRINPAIHDVRLEGAVRAGTVFRWRNGRAGITSRFAVVEPEREITWTGVSFGARAVHRHVLTTVGANRTRVVTAESMSGPLLTLLFSSAKLDANLHDWLAGMKTAAERGVV